MHELTETLQPVGKGGIDIFHFPDEEAWVW